MKDKAAMGSDFYLRRAVETVPSMLAYWDRDLLCRYANPAYERWFGVDPEGLIGRSLRDLLGPELFSLNESYVQAVLNGAEQCFERTVPGPDGVRRHSLAYYIPDIVDGEVAGFVAHVTEVTKLKEAEAALHTVVRSLEAEIRSRRATEKNLDEAQQDLAISLASIEAGFIATDRDGLVVRMNAVAERMTGWSQVDAMGHVVWEVYVHEERSAAYLTKHPIDVMIEEGLTVRKPHQMTLVSRDGRRMTVEFRAALTHALDGSIAGLSIVFRDMTRTLKAEAQAQRLIAIVESSYDAIIGKTLDGRITSWNKAAEAIFGYTAEEAIGRQIQMLIPPQRQHEEMRILTELAKGARLAPFETMRLAKNGRLIDVSLSISPIRDAQGRIIGASKIVRDISERRRAESAKAKGEQLAAENRQIQEASRIKSQFVANMSHELRTPLNAIIGFADLLHSGAVPTESPKHHSFLGHIRTSGRHLLQLINDVLDLAKVESGKFEFYPEPVDLTRLVAEVRDILHTTIDQKNIVLVVDIDPALSDLVLDPARLKQVLFNYLSNALKFTPERGRVTIRARAQGPAHFCLSVEDNGIGIARDNLSRLFAEFYQLDDGYSKRHQGTGLGLALTRRLVRAQGGSVGVRSTLGHGSVFLAVLNRVHGIDAPLDESAPDNSIASAGHRLLLVEDDPLVSDRVFEGLAPHGIDIDVAASCDDALECARHQAYDAMTLDLVLPDGRGLDLLDSLRREGSNGQSPVLGMTMMGPSGEAASFAIANVLAKPLRGDEVAAAMKGFLSLPDDRIATVLVIDDDPVALELMRATLEGLGLRVVGLQDGRQALRELDRHCPDAIVLDLMMPGFDGFQVLDGLQRLPTWRHTPVFIWTSMILTDDEYELLARSARAIVAKGGGALSVLLDGLRRWRRAEFRILDSA